MKKRKYGLIIVSSILLFVMSLSLILPNAINAKNQLLTRNVNVDQIGALSYMEKIEQILEPFDFYASEAEGGVVEFEAQFDFINNNNNLEFLSTFDNDKVLTKKYKTKLDAENEEFYVIIQYLDNDELINEEIIETEPVYNEEQDDYFIQMPGGEIISVKAVLNEENMQECVALTATAAATAGVLAATLLLATVVVVGPQVETSVSYITQTVVSWVKSFFSWFRSILKAVVRTITTAVITQTISYSITYDYKTYKLKPFTKELAKAATGFYLALADTDDGLLYVCPVPLTMEKALPFLVASEAITIASAHKGSSKSFVLSLYTSTPLLACTIAVEAGTLLGNPGAILHYAKKTGYFDHYHPGGLYIREDNPHVFYGLPKV